MKVVILAGGLGTRLSEETEVRPKPMVEVGGRPILWHIMKHYAAQGFGEFCVALGYKGDVIKRFFVDLATLRGSMTVDLSDGSISRAAEDREDWTVHLVETGQDTNTGGRVGRLRDRLQDEHVHAHVRRRRRDRRPATRCSSSTARTAGWRRSPPCARRRASAAWTSARTAPSSFTEKPQMGEGWINGGFMVLEPQVLDYIPDDGTSFESDTLEQLAAEDQLRAFTHEGFWQAMDTLREVRFLRSLWDRGEAPWVTW